ncbi:hypothetical protein A9P44_22025 [Paenibacillus polymyxa]|nr:hypothetical protein AV545_07630 [Paenibacillus jamilae]OBA02241.1 hypothetical protein A9P44_22025 [Paenibacillus polymyxa]
MKYNSLLFINKQMERNRYGGFRNKGKVWNLAKETSREKELAEIITLIRDKVVPLVDKYGANLDEVLEHIGVPY